MVAQFTFLFSKWFWIDFQINGNQNNIRIEIKIQTQKKHNLDTCCHLRSLTFKQQEG